MKFVVVTYGTEGDTRPLAALSRALLDTGHEVRLLADGATLGSAVRWVCAAAPLAGDIRESLRPAKESRPTDTARALARVANANTEAWLRQIVSAGKGCDASFWSDHPILTGCHRVCCPDRATMENTCCTVVRDTPHDWCSAYVRRDPSRRGRDVRARSAALGAQMAREQALAQAICGGGDYDGTARNYRGNHDSKQTSPRAGGGVIGLLLGVRLARPLQCLLFACTPKPTACPISPRRRYPWRRSPAGRAWKPPSR